MNATTANQTSMTTIKDCAEPVCPHLSRTYRGENFQEVGFTCDVINNILGFLNFGGVLEDFVK